MSDQQDNAKPMQSAHSAASVKQLTDGQLLAKALKLKREIADAFNKLTELEIVAYTVDVEFKNLESQLQLIEANHDEMKRKMMVNFPIYDAETSQHGNMEDLSNAEKDPTEESGVDTSIDDDNK
ncbi:unnamed protein product [Hermetia illucens]|uniref:Uncharacterized protein n=1 Tax=Hermetia illucens TaxID=343691 RepID=A0A7R8V8I0_HERIL|nr:uncharacterized protein LOC119660064 [Hermetia illucens]CAD7093475.1 unnamed protein product [Hermetia illucens]